MTHRITTLSKTAPSLTKLKIYDTQHNYTQQKHLAYRNQIKITYSITTLSKTVPSITKLERNDNQHNDNWINGL
jgi:hypothetical protein